MNNSFYLFCIKIRTVDGHYLKIKACVCLFFEQTLTVCEVLRALNNYTTFHVFKDLSSSCFFGFQSRTLVQETSLTFILEKCLLLYSLH